MLAFLLQSIGTNRINSITSDEPVHIAAGLSYLDTGVFRANPEHPPLLKELSALSLLAGGIHWPKTPEAIELIEGPLIPYGVKEWDRYGKTVAEIGNAIIAGNGPEKVTFWARLPMILVAALLAIVIYAWSSRMLGKPAALAALFLNSLDPTILGHSGLVTTDVGLAAFTMLFLFVLWLYVSLPTRKHLLLTGAAMGLALGTKFSAISLPPLCALLLLAAAQWRHALMKPAEAAIERGRALYRSKVAAPMGAFLLILVIAAVIVQAMYFFSRDPLLYMHGFQQLSTNRDATFQPFLAGRLYPLRIYSYFAVAYLLKEPVPNIIMLAIGLFVLFRNRDIESVDKLFLLLPASMLFIGYSLWAENTGIRYIIPVLPLAFMIGGIGLAKLIVSGSVWQKGAGGFLCIWLVVTAAGIYPDHMSYFNEAACLLKDSHQIGLDGGTRCGPLWLDDSNVDWGQGMKQLKMWLDRNAPARTIRLLEGFGISPEAYGVLYDTAQENEVLAEIPPPALYVVSAHFVARLPALVEKLFPGRHSWLENVPPTAIVGHSLYVYDFSRRF